MKGLAAGLGRTKPSIGQVYKALLQAYVNGVAVVPQSYSTMSGRKGFGIYPQASIFNHACDAPVRLEFEGRRLTARTDQDLSSGTQLNISYGPQVQF